MRVVRAPSSPTGTTTSGAAIRGIVKLPPALAEKAATRLYMASVTVAVMVSSMFFAQRLLQAEIAAMQRLPVVHYMLVFVLLTSAGFAAAGRLGLFSTATILNLGIVYQVTTSFSIGVFENGLPIPPDEPVRGLSSLVVWLALCGILIPATALSWAIAATASILAWLGGYQLSIIVQGFEEMPLNRLAIRVIPMAMTAVLVYLMNRRIFETELKAHAADELGSYKLDYLIDRGGMGEVWRASHRLLARDAAIKLIRPEMLASQSAHHASLLRRRFELEAQSIARLKSPHTVALFDFGMADDLAFFYVMELLDGIDLQTLVDRFGPQPAGRVQRILLGVCDSLEEAHRMGLVHRDIKPKNLFITRAGIRCDFAKVLDFGLVKSLKERQDTAMTVEGATPGTPAYMAPEVALSNTIDGRSDIYSLGCVAYFLITGQTVFPAGSIAALALAHVQQTPLPPSRRTELPVPPALDQLILRCLEKDPAARPRSAQELAQLLADAPGIAPWTDEHAHHWWQLNLPERRTPPTASDAETASA